jgi:hypothetical protein
MGQNKGLVIGIVVASLAATGVILYLKGKKAPPPPPPAPVEAPAMPAPAPAPTQMPLPALTASDDFIRSHAASLSSNPGWAEWLKQSDLLNRLAGAVEIMNNGKLPKDAFDFLAPKKKFTTIKNGGKTYLDPKSYSRYDGVASVVDSINAADAAKLFMNVKPLLNEACQLVGSRTCDMQERSLRIIKSLLAVPEVDGGVRVTPKIVTWAMADPALEGLSAPQKVILRMGPKNGPKVQAKLRAFALGIGGSDADLPKPQVYTPKTN